MKEDPHPGYADMRTGIVYDLVAVPRERHSGGRFAMVMQDALARVAREDWPDIDYRVLVMLFSRLDWENYLHLDLTELAKEMNRGRVTVSRSISRLVAAGVLHRGPRVGRSWTYRLDPNLGWKGKPDSRRRVQAELDKRGWTVVDGA